jgi:hypothetical protein
VTYYKYESKEPPGQAAGKGKTLRELRLDTWERGSKGVLVREHSAREDKPGINHARLN